MGKTFALIFREYYRGSRGLLCADGAFVLIVLSWRWWSGAPPQVSERFPEKTVIMMACLAYVAVSRWVFAKVRAHKAWKINS